MLFYGITVALLGDFSMIMALWARWFLNLAFWRKS